MSLLPPLNEMASFGLVSTTCTVLPETEAGGVVRLMVQPTLSPCLTALSVVPEPSTSMLTAMVEPACAIRGEIVPAAMTANAVKKTAFRFRRLTVSLFLSLSLDFPEMSKHHGGSFGVKRVTYSA